VPNNSDENNQTPNYPTSFGRGWIPVERDIGLPEDDCADLREWASASCPLQGSGSEGGGSAPRASLGGESRRSDPSAEGEGLSAATNHNSWTPARKAAFLHHVAEKGNVRAAVARVGLSHQSTYVARRRRSWEREGDGPRIMFLLRSKSIFLHLARVI